MSFDRLIAAAVDLRWLDAGRARVYGLLLALGLAAMTVWLLLAPRTDTPLGGDFLSFYAASKLLLAGHGAVVWRPDLHEAAELSVVSGLHGYLAFFYPPPYLLLCWPLALLPFAASFAVWAIGTSLLALLAMALFLRSAGARIRGAGLALLAFPALWLNILAGQNGALSLAILAAGFALLARHPFAAGAVLGVLVIKPQLAIALPFVLAASGRWRTFGATAASALVLLAIGAAVVGPDGVAAFLANGVNARAALDEGRVDPALMQSLFGALRVAGAPLGFAYAAQVIMAVLVLVAACYAAGRARYSAAALGAITVAATLLTTPFMLDYDLLIAALPVGWLLLEGHRTGFRSGEKLACIAIAVMPLFTRTLASATHLQVAPIFLLALLAMVVLRARGPSEDRASVLVASVERD